MAAHFTAAEVETAGVEVFDSDGQRAYTHKGVSVTLRQVSDRRIEISRTDFPAEGAWFPPKRAHEVGEGLIDIAENEEGRNAHFWVNKRTGGSKTPAADSIEMKSKGGNPLISIFGNNAMSLDPDGCRCSMHAPARLWRAIGADLKLIQPEEDGPATGFIETIQGAHAVAEQLSQPAAASGRSLSESLLGPRA